MDFRELETGRYYREFRGMNGSKIYLRDGQLVLVISYDDILEEEVAAFRDEPVEVVFKTFGLLSLFTFKFREYIVEAPFNQFCEERRWENHGSGYPTEIPVAVLAFESSSGELVAKREVLLPREFCETFVVLMDERYEVYAKKYNVRAFREGMKEIYDNHVIEELYELPGDREIRCFV